MSPEIMPYLINLAKGFTKFCAQTALSLRSKYSQKFYEFCCEFSGNFRYPRSNPNHSSYKKNVYPIYIEQLRNILGLIEKKDERTDKVLTKGKYKNFSDFKRNVLIPAQQELYELYHNGKSEVWFDCIPYHRRGRKVISVLLFIYTKTNPKIGLQKIWEEGDAPLNPFENFTDTSLQSPKKTPSQPCESTQSLLQKIHNKLNIYLEEAEVLFYLTYLQDESIIGYDSYSQVLQVIEAKERQPKFQNGTKAYQRKSIMHYALQENLKEFGWSIPEPPKTRKSA